MEKEGNWFVVAEGVEFLIRRFGGSNSSHIKKLTAQYHKPYARLIELGNLPEDKEREIYVNIFVEGCLIDWRGIKNERGEELPFDKAEAKKLFLELPDMFDSLVSYASDSNNFKDVEDVGNC